MNRLKKLTKDELIDHIEDLELESELEERRFEKIYKHLDSLASLVRRNEWLVQEASSGPELATAINVCRQVRILHSALETAINGGKE